MNPWCGRSAFCFDGNRLQTSIRRRLIVQPKWGIRSHSPQQMVGLESHYKKQGLSVPVRSVKPIFRFFKQPWFNPTRRRDMARHWSARPRLPVRSCWRLQPSPGCNRAAGEVDSPTYFSSRFSSPPSGPLLEPHGRATSSSAGCHAC